MTRSSRWPRAWPSSGCSTRRSARPLSVRAPLAECLWARVLHLDAVAARSILQVPNDKGCHARPVLAQARHQRGVPKAEHGPPTFDTHLACHVVGAEPPVVLAALA